MFDVKEEVREEEGSTWTLCGQLSAWECHRAGHLPGGRGDTATATLTHSCRGYAAAVLAILTHRQ